MGSILVCEIDVINQEICWILTNLVMSHDGVEIVLQNNSLVEKLVSLTRCSCRMLQKEAL